MSCLGILCNRNKAITDFEQILLLNSGKLKDPNWIFECKVEGYSDHWTLLHKVTTLVIGLLAVLGVAGGGALYAVGIINMTTALGIMGGCGALLLIDLGLIVYFRRKHALFLEKLGSALTEYVRKADLFVPKSDYHDILDQDIEVKRARAHDDFQLIAVRTTEYKFCLEFYQSKEAYEKRKEYFENLDKA